MVHVCTWRVTIFITSTYTGTFVTIGVEFIWISLNLALSTKLQSWGDQISYDFDLNDTHSVYGDICCNFAFNYRWINTSWKESFMSFSLSLSQYLPVLTVDLAMYETQSLSRLLQWKLDFKNSPYFVLVKITHWKSYKTLWFLTKRTFNLPLIILSRG